MQPHKSHPPSLTRTSSPNLTPPRTVLIWRAQYLSRVGCLSLSSTAIRLGMVLRASRRSADRALAELSRAARLIPSGFDRLTQTLLKRQQKNSLAYLKWGVSK